MPRFLSQDRGRALVGRFNSSYVENVDSIMQPYWKYSEQAERRHNHRWTRQECLGSITNQCHTLYPFMGAGYNECMLGMNVKQGVLPFGVRAAAAQRTYDLSIDEGGLAYAIGYQFPLCPIWRD
jgi:hypothetical protein